MAERAQLARAPGVKSWDRLLSPLMALSLGLPLFVVAGLDHRFGWSPVFPTWLNIIGILLIAFGYAFASWALAENRFFSSMMRIQTDRGHVVCDSGPYRIVRHPGYAGNLLSLPGIVLALGGMPPLKWSTNWDRFIPQFGGPANFGRDPTVGSFGLRLLN